MPPLFAMRRRVVDADVMEPGLVEETKQRQRSDENRQSNHRADPPMSFLTVAESCHRFGRDLKLVKVLLLAFEF
jgi:hypothetical protein